MNPAEPIAILALVLGAAAAGFAVHRLRHTNSSGHHEGFAARRAPARTEAAPGAPQPGPPPARRRRARRSRRRMAAAVVAAIVTWAALTGYAHLAGNAPLIAAAVAGLFVLARIPAAKRQRRRRAW